MKKKKKKGDTLGQRISFLKNRLGQLCMSHNIQKKAPHIQKYIPRKKYYKKKNDFLKTKPTDKCKCYNCGEEGHKSYECNKRRVKISKIDRIEIDSDLESIRSIESDDFFDEIYEEYSSSSEESE